MVRTQPLLAAQGQPVDGLRSAPCAWVVQRARRDTDRTLQQAAALQRQTRGIWRRNSFSDEVEFELVVDSSDATAHPFEHSIIILYYYTTTNTVTPLWWVRRDLKVSASPVTTSATTGHLLSLRKARGHTRARGRSKSCATARKQHRRACKHPACCNHSGLERGKFCTGRHKVQKQYPESWRAPGSA